MPPSEEDSFNPGENQVDLSHAFGLGRVKPKLCIPTVLVCPQDRHEVPFKWGLSSRPWYACMLLKSKLLSDFVYHCSLAQICNYIFIHLLDPGVCE